MADRISNLPDSILCHILSFLPTKHAAITSVLSKRWTPLWLSVFALNFDNTTFKSSFSFLRAVYSTLYRRDFTLPVHSFFFKCRKNSLCKQTVVNLDIIELVRERGVQSLALDLEVPRRDPSFVLPNSILNCETLEVLKLKGIKMADISQMQNLHLPKLKTLHLNEVVFVCNRHRCNLLLGCPQLQYFESKHSDYSFIENDTPFPPETSKALPNLIKAKISGSLLVCLLSILSNAKILGLDLNMRSSFIKLVLFRTIPMFQRLTHLELNFKSILWYDRNMWLLSMLKHSPKLQSLIIQNTKIRDNFNGECWKDPEIVPECLSELKTCCISGYEGNKWDFRYTKYIIENSKVLDTMTIHSQCSIDINDKHQMLVELSSCTRGSTTCKLLFD